MSLIRKLVSLFLILCLCLSVIAFAEETGNVQERISFLLVCNEGMTNDGDNVGNTMMVVSIDLETGLIRLLLFPWDTFIEYEGYDTPQLIDMPYRNNGPEELLKVFNANFKLDIDLFMSLNYLSLASLIDSYGGVDVDISRAERNALNGMVSSKKEYIKAQADSGILSQMIVEALTDEYYLNDYGPDTHLNGLQAVGFGWLQYDSVYNCCLREGQVVGNLFDSVSSSINEKVTFFGGEADASVRNGNGRRIDLDALTDEDIVFIKEAVAPIFEKSYHNLTEEYIEGISIALARAAYMASRQGVNVFRSLEYKVLPFEVMEPYRRIAGKEGHLIDYEKNAAAMREFLYGAYDASGSDE